MTHLEKHAVKLSIMLAATLVICFASVVSAATTDIGYVANQNDGTISVINLSSSTVTQTISVTTPSEGALTGLTVTPDNKKLYVASFISDTVSVINLETSQITNVITVGDGPNNVAITPDGAKAFVTNNNSNSISVIDTNTQAVVGTIVTDDAPYGMSFSMNGSKLYVSQLYRQDSAASRRVLVINTATNQIISSIYLPDYSRAQEIAITPNGQYAYVAVQDSQQGLMQLDLTSDTFIQNISGVSPNPKGVSISTTGDKAYVTTEGDTVAIVDLITNQVTGQFSNFSRSQGIDISGTGNTLYVTNGGNTSNPQFANTLASVNISTGQTSYIPVGNFPGSIKVVTIAPALTPQQQTTQLINVVTNILVPNNTLNSYLGNLNNANAFITQNKNSQAIKQLEVFIIKVEHDFSKNELTLQQRNELINNTNSIISLLENI